MDRLASRSVLLRLVTRLNVGGPARQAVYLNSAMADRGFDCRLVTGSEAPREGRIDPGTERVTVIPELARQISPFRDLAAGRKIDRLIRSWRPGIVHTHLAKAGALGRLAAHRRRVPVIVHTFHGHVLEGYFSRPKARAFLEIERRLARWTSALIAVSEATRDELLNLGIGRPGQWHVIPVGLELDHLATPPDRREARDRLRLPSDGPLVGIVGRLVPIKDHGTFLQAAARIAAARPDVTFVVAGDGELRETLERRARGLLGERARFLGWVSDLPSLYAALDVVVLTSRNEGTPVSLIEAGAAGRPLVATRVGGVPEVVADGRTGLLVPPADPPAVAGAIERLLADPSLATDMGQRARAEMAERFSATRLADDLAALYELLLAGRRRESS